jgi:hypothetical protein
MQCQDRLLNQLVLHSLLLQADAVAETVVLRLLQAILDGTKAFAGFLALTVGGLVLLVDLGELLTQGTQLVVRVFEGAFFIFESLDRGGGSSPVDAVEVFQFEQCLGRTQFAVVLALLLLQALAVGVDRDESAAHERYLANVSFAQPTQDIAFAEYRTAVREIAWRAQLRLAQRYRHLAARQLALNKICVAIARELSAFVWDIARQVRPAG